MKKIAKAEPRTKAVNQAPTKQSRFVRILAIGRTNKRDSFTLLTRLTADGQADGSIESYGSLVAMDDEDGSWKTSLFRLTNHNGIGRMHYGAFGYEDCTTNIYAKPVEIGELFTVQYDVDYPILDMVFQIERIVPY